jgi:hypothetical protein
MRQPDVTRISSMFLVTEILSIEWLATIAICAGAGSSISSIAAFDGTAGVRVSS